MLLADEEEARVFVAERSSPERMAMMDRFAQLLLKGNQQQNLISANTLSSLWVRHVADSAQLADFIPRKSGTWVDLGSGAGFPGLVIAIMYPSFDVRLIESRKLRIGWLGDTIERLSLTNCRVLGCDVRSAPSVNADVISARAFAPLARLLNLAKKFSTNTTFWVLPKGQSAAQELMTLPQRDRDMFHVEHSVTDPKAGILVGRGRAEGS